MYDCVVCYDMTQDARPSVTSCCHSVVCQACLSTWASSNTSCPACRRNGPTLTTIKLKGAEELFRELKRQQATGSLLRPSTSCQTIGSSLRPSTSAQAVGSSLRPPAGMQGSSTPIIRQTSNPQFVNIANVSNGDLEDIILS